MPQVQHLALSSFLDRHWEERGRLLAAAPASFVLGVLLPAAGQAHMWRGEGAEVLQQGVAAWVGRYAAAQPLPQQQQLVLALLELVGGGSGSSSGSGSSGSRSAAPPLQRPLVQTAAAALVAAARALAATSGSEAGSSSSSSSSTEWQMAFLRQLSKSMQRLSAGWGAGGPIGSFALSVCESLLQAASAAAPLAPAADDGCSPDAVAAAAAWLQQLPLPLLVPGGSLHAQAAAWVGAAGRQRLAPLLAACVQAYMELGSVAGDGCAPAAAAAGESAAWQQQAAGLARLALLLGCQPEGGEGGLAPADLRAAFGGSWADTLAGLYRRCVGHAAVELPVGMKPEGYRSNG